MNKLSGLNLIRLEARTSEIGWKPIFLRFGIVAAFALLSVFGIFATLSFGGTASPPSSAVLSLPNAPSNGTNEVQTLTFGNSISGGTFTLKFGTGVLDQTKAISWSATTNTILTNISTALNKLPGIGAGGVVVAAGTISAGHGTVTVTFSGTNTAKLDVAQIAVGSDNLVGGAAPRVQVSTTTPGVTADGRSSINGTLLVNFVTGETYFKDAGGGWRRSVNAPTPSPTPTPTPTATPTPTNTPTPTATATATATATP